MVLAQAAVVWGDVATWFSGMVGAAVVGISALSLRMSVHATRSAVESARWSSELVRIERERFEAEREDRRREQAVRVNARIVWREKRAGEGRRVEHQVLVVSNASYERVTGVTIVVAGPEPAEWPRPLGWATGDLDVITVPLRVELDELEPDALTGPCEIPIVVVPTGSLEPNDAPDSTIRIRWLPRPAPFAVRAPARLEDPTLRSSPATVLFRDYESQPRSLGDPLPPEGPERDRARYEHVVGLLNRGRGREGARRSGGGERWSVGFTDTHGVRWVRTPDQLVEDCSED